MPDPWFSLQLSLRVAAWATLFVAVLGTALGYLLARFSFPGRAVVDALVTLPLVLPPTVVGYYLLNLLGRQGLLFAWTGWTPLFTEPALVIAAVVMALPLMVKTTRAALESVDTTYEKVAYTLGKSPLATFFQVTLPLAWKGLAAGVILSFARALGEFGATLILAGNIPGKTQTMPLAIYQATQTGADTVALGLVLLLTGVALAILLLANWLGSRW